MSGRYHRVNCKEFIRLVTGGVYKPRMKTIGRPKEEGHQHVHGGSKEKLSMGEM